MGNAAVAVDLGAKLPLYHQVQRQLADEIAQKILAPGARLPAERMLCARFGVSRVTLRRALEALAAEGLIDSVSGRGWFVVEKPVQGPLSPASHMSFTAMGAARGLTASADVLLQRVRPATLDEVEALGIAPGAGIFDLKRLRRLDGMVIAIDQSRVPIQYCPSLIDVDFATASLVSILESRSNIIYRRCSYTVEALPADPDTAALLELNPRDPVLQCSQVIYDQHGRVIELGLMIYRYDRFRFRADLSRFV